MHRRKWQVIDAGLYFWPFCGVEIWPQNWRSLPFWRINILVWGGFTILFFSRTALHLELSEAAVLSTFHLALCFSLAGLLEWVYRHIERELKFDARTAGIIVGLSLGATVLQSTAAQVLIVFLGWNLPGWSLLELWLMRVMFFWLVYMSWSLLFFWIRAERHAAISEKKSQEAQAETGRVELQLLRSQLDPHFLFNALNGISSASASGAPHASCMARELADYLRYSLDHRHDTEVPLKKEVEAMMAYLKVEEARFGDGLEVSVHIDSSAEDCEIPCFLLLPLVENSVKHSLRTAEPPWKIEIRANLNAAILDIEVRNTGTLASKSTGGGIGLEVLRRRLQIHYPGRHHLDLAESGGMVCAKLILEGTPCFA